MRPPSAGTGGQPGQAATPLGHGWPTTDWTRLSESRTSSTTYEMMQCTGEDKQCTHFNGHFWSTKSGNLVKCKFLYSAVSSPQDRSKRFTLYFPDRPVHSDTISGSIQPYATINARRLLVHISTTVYSHVLIYTAE